MTVPPRELAATITAQALLRAGWAVAAVYLMICAIGVIDLGLAHGHPERIAIPLAAVLVMAAALVMLAKHPSLWRGVLFLAVGTIATFVYDFSLLDADPELGVGGIYLLNRMVFVLLLVGPVSSRITDGFWWCTSGYLLGTLAMIAAQVVHGQKPYPGWGPLAALVIYLGILLTFVTLRRRVHRFTPDFSAIDAETSRMAGIRELEERAVSIIHDTVLSDLTAASRISGKLDERARTRFLRDINELARVTLPLNPSLSQGSVGYGQDIRVELLALINEFQWRGLAVDVTGGTSRAIPLDAKVADATIGAIRSSLDNVVDHSGSSSAEVFIDASETFLSVMVVDQGNGFDRDRVPSDRLGITHSIVKRIDDIGGTVRFWSALGAGTSVVITVPMSRSTIGTRSGASRG